MNDNGPRINFSIDFAKQLAAEHKVPLQICVRALKGAEGDQLIVEGYLHAAVQQVEEVEDREQWNWEQARLYKEERLAISAKNKPKRKQPVVHKAEEEADASADTVQET